MAVCSTGIKAADYVRMCRVDTATAATPCAWSVSYHPYQYPAFLLPLISRITAQVSIKAPGLGNQHNHLHLHLWHANGLASATGMKTQNLHRIFTEHLVTADWKQVLFLPNKTLCLASKSSLDIRPVTLTINIPGAQSPVSCHWVPVKEVNI